MGSRTYFIDQSSKTINLTFSAEPEIRKLVKLTHINTRWNPTLKQWIIPVDGFSKPRILHIVREFGFVQVDHKEEEVRFRYEKDEVDYKYLKEMVGFHDFEYEPRDYQLDYLAYALEHRNVICGDDVGLGKTFESIIYTEVTHSYPCLVIVPASVKYNWAAEWKKILKGKRSISVIESRPKKSQPNNWDADVVIINYDIIGKKQGTGATLKFEELDREVKMLICDEAHFLKNTKAIRTKAANRIKKRAGRIQLLTGTATMNKPIEIWNLLGITGIRDRIVKNWQEFVFRYCGGYKGKFGWVTDGATNTLELNLKLRQNGYIRREKSDVLTELPKMIKQIVNIPISNKRDYDRALGDFLSFVEEAKGEEAMLAAMEAEHLVRLGMLRKMSAEGKLKSVEQYLKEWKETGRKLVVFGIHSEQLKYLSEKFNCPLIAGGVTAEQKQKIKEDWISSDDIFLFGNIDSMGTGVDGLQYVCSDMVIYELPWRPSDLTQVMGRLHRSGQTVPPNINYLLSDYNIDVEMWEMLSEKEAVTEAVNKGIDVRKRGSGMKNVMKKLLKKNKK